MPKITSKPKRKPTGPRSATRLPEWRKVQTAEGWKRCRTKAGSGLKKEEKANKNKNITG